MNTTHKWLDENIALSEEHYKEYYLAQFKEVVKEIKKRNSQAKKIICSVCKTYQDVETEFCKRCGAKIEYSFQNFIKK